MPTEMMKTDQPEQLTIGEVTAPAKPKKPTVLQRLSLYDITLEGKMIEDILIEGDGELTPETEKRMDDLLRSGKPKIEAACLVIKELEASEEAAAKEKKRMDARKASFERNAEGLKARVVAALDAAFSGKIKTDRVTVYTQKSPDSVTFEFLGAEGTLENLHNSHPELVKREVVYSLDREALLKLWEKEKPLRDQWMADYAAALEAASNGAEDAKLPEDFPSDVPDVIQVTENEGRRFLQIR